MTIAGVKKTILFLNIIVLSVFLALPVVVKAADFSGVESGGSSTAPAAVNASADDFIPEIPIPGLFEGRQPMTNELMADYIRAIFIYFVWTVGIIATVMVIYGGIKWVAAAGNPGQIKDARDIIDSAIIGVIIALTSVVLLNVINPKLTNLSVTGLTKIEKKFFVGAHVTKICDPDPQIACGAIKIIGKAKVDGKEVNDYCIGTTCPRGGIKGYGEHTNVCSITQDAKKEFYLPYNGCVDTITHADGVTRPISQPFNTFVGGVQYRLKCGTMGNLGEPKDVGGWCQGEGVSVIEDEDPQCYLLGPQASPIVDNPGTEDDIIPNLCCPGKTCPHETKYTNL